MQTKSDTPIPEVCGGIFWIPVMIFQIGLLDMLAPLDEGLSPWRRFRGLCVLLLGTPLAVLGALLLPLLTFVLFSLSALWMLYAGETAQFSREGVVVSSRRRGGIARLDWSDIACMRKVFYPPFGCWEIVTKAGDVMPLPLANDSELITACETAGVPVWRDDSGVDG